MAEISKKKPRKSKLVPRDCDLEDDKCNTSNETKDPKSALSNLLSKIDNDKSPQKSTIKVSVSIEIERDIQDEEECDVDVPKGKLGEPIYKQCLLPDSVVKEETLRLMKISQSTPDKIIEVEIRNNWGKFVQPKEEKTDVYDSAIQAAICNFKQWNYQSKVRENILSYKCYICNIGWWRLTPFRYHIKQHNNITVDIEPFHHECCIVAFRGEQPLMREVRIDGLCNFCQKTSRQHEIMKRHCMYYFCDGCNLRLFTCASIFNHEGSCAKFQYLLLVKDKMTINEYCVCTICNVNCLTQKRYEQHMILRHSVRSDEPVTYFWPRCRACVKCGSNYFFYHLHLCQKKYENKLCTFCYRKFQQQWQLDIHLATNKRTINCRICYKGLHECNELEHMMKHSKNYVMAYKCQKCDTNVLYPDKYSAEKHCVLGHNNKRDSKLKDFHFMIVPKELLLANTHVIDLLTLNRESPPDKVKNDPTKSNEQPTMPELVLTKNCQVRILKLNATESKYDPVNSEPSKQGKNLKLVKARNGRNKKFEVVERKNRQNKNEEIITGENLQEHILKDLLEQEKALDAESIVEHDEKTLEYNGKLLDHDYVINTLGHRYPENITGVFKQEPNEQYSDDQLTYIKKENIDHDSLNQDNNDIDMNQDEDREREIKKEKEDGVIVKTELLDNIVLYPDYNMTGVPVKEEIVEDNLSIVFQVSKNLSSVYQASTDISGEVQTMIKEEPMDELEYEDDIIVLNNDNFTIEEHSLFKSNGELLCENDSNGITPSEFHEDNMSKFEPEIIVTNKSADEILQPEIKIVSNNSSDNNVEPEIKIVSNRNLLRAALDLKKIKQQRGTRLYKCVRCNYEAVYREYKNHVVQCQRRRRTKKITNEEDKNLMAKKSPWKQYYCTKCNCIFFTLKKYLMHFVTHNVQQGSCPVCGIIFSNTIRFGTHFISHIQNSYTYNELATQENEYISKKNDKLINENNDIMMKNEDLIKANEKVINANRKLMNEQSSSEQIVEMSKKNSELLSENHELVTKNEELMSRNNELDSKWQGVGKDGVYKCKKCQEKVSFMNSFSHFEQHLQLEPTIIKTEANEDQLSENNEVIEASILSPDLLKNIIDAIKSPKLCFILSPLKKCVVCARAFDRRNDGKRHLIEHLLRDAYASYEKHRALKCQLCQMLFEKPPAYKQHMRNHAGLPIYKCVVCDKSFSDSSNFAKHKKVHNFGVLICDICNKKFHSKHHIEKHMEMHLSTEPIECTQCTRMFHTPSMYHKHVRLQHTKLKFTCIVCKEKFDTLKCKWDHLWEKHQQRKHKADCPICGQSFRKFQDVRTHIRLKH